MSHALSTPDLAQSIAQLAANINAATCRLLTLIEAFDRREGWAGFNSCAHWLNWRCGIALGAAREKVRVARTLVELPAVRGAFECGEISYSKVRALTRIATADNEAYLLQIARHGTAAHMERMVGSYRRLKRSEAALEARDRHEQQSLEYYWDEDGMLVIRGRFTPEQGALILKALEAGAGSVWQRQRGEDAIAPVGQRRAEALADMAETFLEHGTVQRNGGDRYLVTVHTTPAALQRRQDSAPSEVEPGRAIAADTARRLSCDAAVVPVLETGEGEPLAIGRKSRSIPPALRRALQLRDRGCRFPGCTRRHALDGHHIEHWADGGETRLDNLVSLCRQHHRLVHEAGYTIRQDGRHGLLFVTPDGRTLQQSPPLTPPQGELISDPQLQSRIDKRNDTLWDGQAPDHALMVDHLVYLERGTWAVPRYDGNG